jgi:hypothetical protein
MVRRLAADIDDALSQPRMRAWLVDHDGDPLSMSPKAFAGFVFAESERAARIVGRA